MRIENRAIFVFTLIGLFLVIPLVASTFETSPVRSLTPTGMMLESVKQEQNYTIPMSSHTSFGPEGYEKTIQTPYGKYTMKVSYDQIKYGLESFEKSIFITVRADMMNEFYTTHDYYLNITKTPEKTVDHFSNTVGWVKVEREGGTDTMMYYGSNFTYLEKAYQDAKASLEQYKSILEQIRSGAESMDSSGSSLRGSVFINEFMANPGTNQTEWIEIYNNRSSSVDIGGWTLDDAAGGSSPYDIPQGTVLQPKGFIVFYGNETGVQLNNNGDSVRLLDSEGNIVDSYDYSSSTSGVSIGRIPDGSDSWSNITSPTPGLSNG